jgi:hypothetical protein
MSEHPRDVVFHGPGEWGTTRPMVPPYSRTVVLPGPTPETQWFYRLTQDEDAYGHPMPVYVFDHAEEEV